MRINKVTFSSKCKDGSLVKEYILNSPVNHQDIIVLKCIGSIMVKEIGDNELFTFTSDILNIKGMIGDTIVYATYRKEDTASAEKIINQAFETGWGN